MLPSQLLGWDDQGLAFDTAVHFGSLLALLIFFRTDLARLIGAGSRKLAGDSTVEGSFALNLLIASLPIIPVGYLARFFIEDQFRSLEVIATTTIVFGLALWAADRSNYKGSKSLTPLLAIWIGVAQCLALIPGTSRSGITMTAALLAGFSRTDATKISLLISIPTILAATCLKLFDLASSNEPTNWYAVCVGVVVSSISAYLCIKFLLSFIEQIGFLPFVAYRLMLGTILLVILAI
mgnify:FL=1